MPTSKLYTSTKELVVSADGTHTLFSHAFGEPYHSTKDGALHESLHKHVQPALALQAHKSKLTILDICFGLGYNSFATLYYIKKQKLQTNIHILSPEFDEDLVRSLDGFDFPAEFDEIKEVIAAVSKEFYYEDEQFTIEVLPGDARESILKIKEKIDIIYQDAFSPKVNPMLWTYEWFRDIKALCHTDAILTTYSTAASTRMALHENGFRLYYHQALKARRSLIASLSTIEGFEPIDMVLKIKRNPTARSLKDAELF